MGQLLVSSLPKVTIFFSLIPLFTKKYVYNVCKFKLIFLCEICMVAATFFYVLIYQSV